MSSDRLFPGFMSPEKQLQTIAYGLRHEYKELDELLTFKGNQISKMEDELENTLKNITDVCGETMTVTELLQKDIMTTLVLVPYLPDNKTKEFNLWKTFDFLWKWIMREHKEHYRDPLFEKAENIRLSEKIIPPQPGFRWELLSLGINGDIYPNKPRNPHTSPHLGVLAAAALNPHWAHATDGSMQIKEHPPWVLKQIEKEERWENLDTANYKGVPSVRLPGLEVCDDFFERNKLDSKTQKRRYRMAALEKSDDDFYKYRLYLYRCIADRFGHKSTIPIMREYYSM